LPDRSINVYVEDLIGELESLRATDPEAEADAMFGCTNTRGEGIGYCDRTAVGS